MNKSQHAKRGSRPDNGAASCSSNQHYVSGPPGGRRVKARIRLPGRTMEPRRPALVGAAEKRTRDYKRKKRTSLLGGWMKKSVGATARDDCRLCNARGLPLNALSIVSACGGGGAQTSPTLVERRRYTADWSPVEFPKQTHKRSSCASSQAGLSLQKMEVFQASESTPSPPPLPSLPRFSPLAILTCYH